MMHSSQTSTSKQASSTELSSREASILTMIQAGFPVAADPYAEIGAQCGCSTQEAYDVVSTLRKRGDIRRVGAVFDSAHLGYVSTLCALAEERPECIESTAAIVGSYAEVTHNYLREDRYNIWFTLIARDQDRIDEILREIAEKSGAFDILDLPAYHLFKIRVDFNLTGEQRSQDEEQRIRAAEPKPNPREVAARAPELTSAEQALVRKLQGDLSGTMYPFAQVSEALSEQGYPMTTDEVIETTRRWQQEGVIRRMGAVVRHRSLGFTYNAMSVWDIPEEVTEQAGALLAQDSRVSHCYERPRKPTWDANVYAMIHATEKETCFTAADEMHARLAKAGIDVAKPRLLFSTKEFKKRSMRYFCENVNKK